MSGIDIRPICEDDTIVIERGTFNKIKDERDAAKWREGVKEKALQECVNLLDRHIYPKPDVSEDHPYAVLQRAREALKYAGQETSDG